LKTGAAALFDMAVMREPGAALADVDGSEFPGPLVHIAEQTPMNRPQMREVEIPFQGRLRKLVRTCRNNVRFGLFEDGFVSDAETII